MKLQNLFIKPFTVIAQFGDAQLIQTLDHKFKLQGGSASDQIEAREWISMFLHDVVVEMPKRNGPPSSGVRPGFNRSND